MRGREATGSPVRINGKWYVRVTDPVTKKRPYIPLGDEVVDEETARQIAPLVSSKYRDGGMTLANSPETVSEWFDRWIGFREKKFSSTRNDRSRFTNHVEPLIGKLPMKSVAKHDLERVVRSLDEKVSAGNLSWKTAINVWAVVTKMFTDAACSKIVELRVREDDPSDKVEGPDTGAARAKAYLYPSEFLQLVSCEQVPLRWRQIFAICTYLYTRRGELAALKVGDVDLVHGVVHIHAAEGENTTKTMRELGATKTGITRRMPIEATLKPLLEAVCKGRHKSEFLLSLPWEDQLARGLRKYLLVAGVDREELHTDDATRKSITFHDLRATGITWAAVRGDEPLRIRQRAGHSDFVTTQKYVRTAENLRDVDFGETFPKLPESLLTAHPVFSSGNSSAGTVPMFQVSKKIRLGSCEGGGDLNITQVESFSKLTSDVDAILHNAACAADDDFEAQMMALLERT